MTCRTNRVGPDIEAGRVATKVELGTSDISGNIAADLESFGKVIVCSDDKQIIERVGRDAGTNRVLSTKIEKVPALFGQMQMDEQESSV